MGRIEEFRDFLIRRMIEILVKNIHLIAMLLHVCGNGSQAHGEEMDI